MVWPRLREEIELFEGPRMADGQPSWTLHDPTRNQFFRIDWMTFEILCHWSIGSPDAIASVICSNTPLHPEARDVEAVVDFLTNNELIKPAAGTAARMAATINARRQKFWTWLLHHYLFFRLPLIKPDAWLSHYLPKIEFFYSRQFFRLTAAAGIVGMLQIYRQWEQFSATLVDSFTWQGALCYGITLFAVKGIHELGHAFTAKRYGCRIPTMGLAFLVMWPVAYTDTNEVWKLREKNRRLAVAAAGVASELIVAAWALLFWSFLPEGLPKSVAFMLGTTIWVSSVMVNLSPFMRFDGYFLLLDYLDMPNLHARAFALARWDIRERLFKFQDAPPEIFKPEKQRGLVIFAWLTWAYRLALLLGVAALVYHFFIKAIGIFLFLIEFGVFIFLPIYKEAKIWFERRNLITKSSHGRRSIALAIVILGLFVIPWPSRVTSSGILRPVETWPIYAPQAAQIIALPVANGDIVEKGTLIIQISSPELSRKLDQASNNQNILRWRSATAGLDSETKQNQQALAAEEATANAQLQAVTIDLNLFSPKAPFDGRLVDLDPDLRPGMWVEKKERIATLVSDKSSLVETFLDEEEVSRVQKADGGFFISDSLTGPTLSLHVISIDKDATRMLPDGLLAAENGGSIMTRVQHGNYVPERAVYRVHLLVDSETAEFSGKHIRGTVVIRGDWEAPGFRFLRSAFGLLWRELGF
jgi:putative peptide zinc metalloprotease protein